MDSAAGAVDRRTGGAAARVSSGRRGWLVRCTAASPGGTLMLESPYDNEGSAADEEMSPGAGPEPGTDEALDPVPDADSDPAITGCPDPKDCNPG